MSRWKNKLQNNYNNYENNYLNQKNKFYIFNYSNNYRNYSETFKIIDINYIYSKEFNLVKIKYKIGFFENNQKIITPSELVLYKNIQIICFIKIIKDNSDINSLPNIYNNFYYECIDYFKLNEKIKLGIKIFHQIEENIEDYKIFFLPNDLIKKRTYIYKEDEFDSLFLNKIYINTLNSININKKLKLKKSYIQFPINNLKRYLAINENFWYFKNIYGNYFCFCKGEVCLRVKNYQRSKYFFYLNIIDKNKNIYPKNHYLFIDFIFSEYSSDDAFPIFKEMEKQNYYVHYISEKIKFYQQFCFKGEKCLKIILVNMKNYTINGDFLQKYLTLILKLKIVISGGGVNFDYINNIFFNIDYITYICVGHGVSFFKYFLYSDECCYGKKRYDKLLIPPSNILINVAKKYGWNDENIIKINLPRWDKYNYNNLNILYDQSNIYNNSIFIMFTWRHVKKYKLLSKLYFENIINLISNEKLNYELNNKNIKVYFTLHHKLMNYKNKFKNNKYIQFIEENKISQCLLKANLIVSDFSSIIFDFIYRRMPFIIYIPDAYETDIESIYDKNYFELIQSFKNGTINFINQYYEINKTINKIIFYIRNDFHLEPNFEEFYNNFNLKKENNTKLFINYITKEII